MDNCIYQKIVKEFNTADDIENLDRLSVRTYNALKRAGVNHISELREMTAEELLQIRNIGKNGLANIAATISDITHYTRRTMTLILDIEDVEALASGMAKTGVQDKNEYIQRLIQASNDSLHP